MSGRLRASRRVMCASAESSQTVAAAVTTDVDAAAAVVDAAVPTSAPMMSAVALAVELDFAEHWTRVLASCDWCAVVVDCAAAP